MNNGSSILFVGDLNEYGRSFQRYRTLRALGYEVDGVSMVSVPFRPGIEKPSFLVCLLSKLRVPLDETNANAAIRAAVRRQKFDLIWIEKGNTILPSTLHAVRRALPQVRFISISEDDMYARHNRSWYYTRGLPLYDVVFTTKTYNLEELKCLGARRTELFLDSFDETLHRPLTLSREDSRRFGCDVGFIGTFERDRARIMLFLAENGVRVVVWGNGWEYWSEKHSNLIIKNQPLYGEDYVKAINAAKINLCFLRKMNRDEVTSRSVEIPACGAFILAERTKRHLEFFEEGKEAVFFSTPEELLTLTHQYLTDGDARQRIAAAGRERCIKSGYDMKTQLSSIIARAGMADLRSAR